MEKVALFYNWKEAAKCNLFNTYNIICVKLCTYLYFLVWRASIHVHKATQKKLTLRNLYFVILELISYLLDISIA
ncbi:hypothetical protein AB205_0019840 [Aquarana catesbeiana]|uniref:Uncharacterized protein n=1 Tax=Aquarana catesbeiana TaxID=8400 RepID=A0A2G9S209_AQUCT|nr:hypothetical protein AB205_0019840 [Aquarana catesbeiana]